MILEALAKVTSAGRLFGPLKDFPFVHTSSLGAVPKKLSINKWRLILDPSPKWS